MFEAIEKRQKRLLIVVVCIASIGAGIVFWLFFFDQTEDSSLKPNVLLGYDRIDPKEVWVHQIQTENKLLKKKIDAIELMMKKIIEQHETQAMVDTSSLRQKLQDVKEEEVTKKQPIKSFDPFPASLENDPKPIKHADGISKISLKIVSKNKLKTTDTHVPSGSFAQAVLLGGVDASTSIQSSSEPRPVLLKIIDFGTLPRSFRSDLKDCHVIGASYGDMASQRVYVRLEKLSAVERLSGEIVEIPIKGYIAGEDGKTGIKGILIDRSDESMRNALIGGFLSGIGGFLSQSKNPITFTPTSPFGQTQASSAKQMIQEGASKGLSNAFEKYADFYIKRAEQMQPVLEIEAGRVMDIVITEGFDMSDSTYKKKLSQKRDEDRYNSIERISTTQQEITQ